MFSRARFSTRRAFSYVSRRAHASHNSGSTRRRARALRARPPRPRTQWPASKDALSSARVPVRAGTRGASPSLRSRAPPCEPTDAPTRATAAAPASSPASTDLSAGYHK